MLDGFNVGKKMEIKWLEMSNDTHKHDMMVIIFPWSVYLNT